jgi:hypothetical protein
VTGWLNSHFFPQCPSKWIRKKKLHLATTSFNFCLRSPHVSSTVRCYFLTNNLIYDEMKEMNTETKNRYVKNLTIAGKFYVGKTFHLDETLALIM